MYNLRHKDFPYGFIQVAGVHDLEEAALLLDAGVHLLGLPLRLPVNREDISEQDAAHLSRKHPGRCCLITYLDNVDEICEFTSELAVDYVQLHGAIDPAIMPELRRRLPLTRFIKSLVIGKDDFQVLLELAQAFAPHVWAFITDTFDPATGAEGATGLTHDWNISRQLVESAKRPVILAGGLNPSNVRRAILAAKPMGVDVHTGVENRDGRKDLSLVTAFVNASRAAFKAVSG